MINQITPVSKSPRKPVRINRALLEARRIQAKLKDHHDDAEKPENGILWSPISAGPYLVPVLRWIE